MTWIDQWKLVIIFLALELFFFDNNDRLRSRVGLQDRDGDFRGNSGGGDNISEGYSWNCQLPLDMSCGDQVMGQSGVKRDLYPGLSSREWRKSGS